MRDVAKKKLPDETLQLLCTGHLPPAVRAVLSIRGIKDLNKLTRVADTAMENILPRSAQECRPDILINNRRTKYGSRGITKDERQIKIAVHKRQKIQFLI